MAPATSLQLLHIAAVLVMVASPGGVLAEVLFPSDVLVSTFDVLRERKCLPGDFDTSTITKAGPCSMKVKSGDVSYACASTPIMAQFYNCYAHSVYDFDSGFSLFLGWYKYFYASRIQERLSSFTNDNTWKQQLYDRMSFCQLMAPAGLTPEQEAVQMYMCIKFSLFANCDRDLVDRGSLDAVGMVRRAHFLVHNVKLWVSALGQDGADAWASCSENMSFEQHDHGEQPEGVDPAVHYADVVFATSCLLDRSYDFSEGTSLFFYQLSHVIPNSVLQSLACGPIAVGNAGVAIEKFLECMINVGVLLEAARDANQAAVSMSKWCTISA